MSDGDAPDAASVDVPPLLDFAPLELPPLPPDLFINRELSWLAFNRRVLAETADPGVPLLERVKFMAIFSANLDEFFMIRVANLKRKLLAGIAEPGPDGRTPIVQAALLHSTVQEMLTEQSRIFRNTLTPELRDAGIEIERFSDLPPREAAYLARYFESDIFPVLTPQAVDRARRFPHVSNQSLNLMVFLRTADAGARYARIKIPAILPRLVPVGPEPGLGASRFVWLEDLVASQLGRLFPGAEIAQSFPFHVNRDFDIDVDEDEDDARDLLVSMEEQLSQRTFGSIVQLMVNESMPEDLRVWLLAQLHASERELYVVDGPLALEGLFALLKLDRPDLKDPPLIPAPLYRNLDLAVPPGETGAWGGADIFGTIRERDVLIHHPYQSFGAVVDFLRAASRDPNVVAIKQTLYRIGKNSPLIPALIEARDDDSQVAVLMEVKARFDEENNILGAHELEEHGVHVAYGLAGLKTHCKLMLVIRREPEGLRRYAHLSTGNYNASTARMYEDFGYFTAREEITRDVSELFNVLTGYSQQESYRRLWVAPMTLRHLFLESIAREIRAHEAHGGGRLIFKMNSLVDRELIRALYAASRAGVQIDLIVRGICCLRPGVPGWSETIRVRSIVGRFLEHSRIFHFRNGGDDQLYLSSADLMERNLDRRVEVVFPVEDAAIKAELRDVVLDAYLRDTVNAMELFADGDYRAVEPEPGQTPFDVHRWLIARHRLPRAGEG
ncbi:MAG: polyphosphate kinase 1 [Thermomicrobiales bacterium]